MIPLPEGAHLGALTTEKLDFMWKFFREHDALFPEDYRGNPEGFYKEFLVPTTFLVEVENGVIWLRKVKIGRSAEVHFAFWDFKLSPKTETLRELLTWGFITLDLQRVETRVADYAKAVRRFIERKLGFVHEGTLRQAVMHHGVLTDVHLYSILRDEVL